MLSILALSGPHPGAKSEVRARRQASVGPGIAWTGSSMRGWYNVVWLAVKTQSLEQNSGYEDMDCHLHGQGALCGRLVGTS